MACWLGRNTGRAGLLGAFCSSDCVGKGSLAFVDLPPFDFCPTCVVYSRVRCVPCCFKVRFSCLEAQVGLKLVVSLTTARKRNCGLCGLGLPLTSWRHS